MSGGSRNIGNPKLNPQSVMEIRRLRAEGYTQPRLARLFKVSTNQIAKICDGTAWAWVTGGEEIRTDAQAEMELLLAQQRMKETLVPPPDDGMMERLMRVQEETNRAREGQQAVAGAPETNQRAMAYKGYPVAADPEDEAKAWAQRIKDTTQEAEERRRAAGLPPIDELVIAAAMPQAQQPTAATAAERLLNQLKTGTGDSQDDHGNANGAELSATQQPAAGGAGKRIDTGVDGAQTAHRAGDDRHVS